MKLDLLFIVAHPDDAEISCGGTIAKAVAAGNSVGIIDMTGGELGTRGTMEIRAKEAEEAAQILGLKVRENLWMADGFFVNDKTHQLPIITKIRQYQPDVIVTNAIDDRHPDHGKASRLVSDAAFLSGLRKIETSLDGPLQDAWRPRAVYHMLQDRWIEPDFVVDITGHFETKMESIKAFGSQFHDPNSTEPETPISGVGFMKHIEGRAMQCGRLIDAEYGEGYTTERPVGTGSILSFL